MATLLAVWLLAAFAACGTDKQGQSEQNGEFAFLQGRQITQAEVDSMQRSLSFNTASVTQVEALQVLMCRRVYVWEAESLGLLPNLAEIEKQNRESFEELRSWAAGIDDEKVVGAQEAWQVLQDYFAYMDCSEEEYLAWAAEVRLSEAALAALLERLSAELSPAEEELAQVQSAYLNALVVKYRDYLVEEDLRPLLAEALLE